MIRTLSASVAVVAIDLVGTAGAKQVARASRRLARDYLVLAGTRSLSSASDLSRFGSGMFGLLAPLQLIVLSCQAAVGASSSVAQEKDRRTLLLLLMTQLSGREVVVG